LSWTIDFVDYSEARSGTALHTITEFDLSLDANAITSVDYFKKESRRCSVSFFDDSWISEYITPFINGQGNILDTHSYYWKYVLRIKHNGNVEYIGYLKRNNVKYNKADKTYSIRLTDTFGIYVDLAHGETTSGAEGQVTYTFDGLLFQSIYNIIGNGQGGFKLDTQYIANYDLVSGLEVSELELYNKNNDNQLIPYVANIDNWEWFVDDIVTLTSTVWEGVVKQHAVIYLSNGKPRIVLMKYFQQIYNGGYRLFERIYVKTFTINQDVWIEDSELVVQENFSEFTNIANNVSYANELNLYDDYYTDLGYPASDAFYLGVGNDFYELTEHANELNYSGNINFEEVVVDGSQKRQYLNDLKMCLLMNNLTLYIHNDGVIEVINKTLESGDAITISNNDIISMQETGIIKQTPDYMSYNSGMIEINQRMTSDAEANYYDELFESLTKEINIQIENNYDLSLNNIVTVYGNNYKINSIHLDNDRFIYTIKAWGV
jgi:hypothetical protein